MRIKDLDIASFGKLSDRKISLDERITVVFGRNEAGKSSIASFIKYMLYGFDASKKNDVASNHKKKYMPWSTGECSGSMTFTSADGKTYTATRKTAQRSQNTVFDSDGMPLTEDNAGDFFLGVNENTYKKTAFIGQSEAVFSDGGELDAAIRNIVFSGDEEVDSAKAVSKLDDIRKYYLGKTGRSGLIYEIDKELTELTATYEALRDRHKQLMSAEHSLAENQRRIAYNEEQKAIFDKKLQNILAFAALKKLEEIEEAKRRMEEGKQLLYAHCKEMQTGSFSPDAEYEEKLEAAVETVRNLESRKKELEVNLENALEGRRNVYSDEKAKRIFDLLAKNGITGESLLEKVKKLISAKKKWFALALVLTLLVVTLPVAIVFWVLYSGKNKEIGQIISAYGCKDADDLVSSLVAQTSFKAVEESAEKLVQSAKNSLRECVSALEEKRKALEDICAPWIYETDAGEDVCKTAEEYLARLCVWLEKKGQISTRCHDDYVGYNALVSAVNIDELTALSAEYDGSPVEEDEKTVRQKLAFHTQALDMLKTKNFELEKTAAVLTGTMAKPAEMQSRILSLTEQKKSFEEKHSAIVVAIDALTRASENMRSEVSPRIAAETSNLFSGITGGKYKALYAGENMTLSFLEEGEAEVRDAGYLSTGTLDAAYISLRIALCKFLYKEKPTLVFDDAFSHMDDERLADTVSFLEKLSDDFQIVILSCHDREKKLLSGKATVIEM